MAYTKSMSKVLEYKDWRNFEKVIKKATVSAENSISSNEDWVVEINKPIKTGKGKQEYDSLSDDEKRFYQRKLTKQKLIRDNIQGEKEAKNAHYEVGQKVRKAIADIGGTMPEEMPTPKKSLKELEREKKQLEIKQNKKLEEIK